MNIPNLNTQQKKALVDLATEVYPRISVTFDDDKKQIELQNSQEEIIYKAHWFIFCTNKLVRDIHGEFEVNYNETRENLAQEHKVTIAEIITSIKDGTAHPVDILCRVYRELSV